MPSEGHPPASCRQGRIPAAGAAFRGLRSAGQRPTLPIAGETPTLPIAGETPTLPAHKKAAPGWVVTAAGRRASGKEAGEREPAAAGLAWSTEPIRHTAELPLAKEPNHRRVTRQPTEAAIGDRSPKRMFKPLAKRRLGAEDVSWRGCTEAYLPVFN